MKKTFLVAITTMLMILTANAQMVNPNKPFRTLSSQPGYLSTTELAVGFGLGDTEADYSKSFIGLTEVVHFQFTKSINAGIGTGALFYNGGSLVPLFLDFRYKFMLHKVTPYLFMQSGAMLKFSDFNSSMIFVAGGGGGQYAFSRRLAANLGLGLMIQSGGYRYSFITLRGGVTYMF
jgi:hypothetical protein